MEGRRGLVRVSCFVLFYFMAHDKKKNTNDLMDWVEKGWGGGGEGLDSCIYFLHSH